MRIGCSGWYYEHWKGCFYPEDLPKSRWFRHYAENFDTVELNSPFYHFPKISTAKTWYRQAPEGFVYSLKANRAITHMKKFKGTKRLIREFYKVGEELKEKLGCFLFQLPPNLHYHEQKLLEILDQLDESKRNVIEFRHESWWNKDVYREMKGRAIFCVVSHPSLPDDFVRTMKEVYVRFHGNRELYSSKYSRKELEEWAKKMGKRSWAYFNNDFYCNAVKDAKTLLSLQRSSR